MSIAKRPDGRWRARYRDHDHHEHSRHFPRKIDAERWLAQETADLSRGAWIDPRAGIVTFQEYAEQWRASKAAAHRPSSAAHVETMLRCWAYPTLGDRQMSTIKPSDLRAWVQAISPSLAPSTVAVGHGIVATIFKAAVADGVIVTSPVQKQSGKGYLPERTTPKVDPFTVQQVRTVAEAVPARYRALVMLAAGTGMRQGECLGLTEDRVDFVRRTIRVDRQLVYLPRLEPRFGPPKTKASDRMLPLPQAVADELSAHMATYPPGVHQLLFVDHAGRPLRRSVISHMWRRAAKAAGLPTERTFHDLRHFYASLLIRHGESVKVVQSRLGHATAAETLDTYSHLWPDSDDQTRAAVDSVLLAKAPETLIEQIAD